MKRYNTFAQFLRDRFGQRLIKICLDGGFTCPNRDGTCGIGGCIYCGHRGAGEHIATGKTIRQQVLEFLNQPKVGKSANKPDRYIAYFQNFSNTYANTTILRERYDQALLDDRIVAMAIGTRPDCIDEQIARLLAEYGQSRYTWVELGLQTANDRTATLINRGYPSSQFTRAVELLNENHLDIVAHLIIGLPGETLDDLKKSVSFINCHRIQGIKLHSLYVMEGTVLARWYRENRFTLLTKNEYIEQVIYVLTHIRPELIVHRLTGDCQKELLVAPEWNKEKNAILTQIDTLLEQRGLRQGCFLKEDDQ